MSGVPEISVVEFARLREQGEPLQVLDVREAPELELAKLPGEFLHAPISRLAHFGLEGLPQDQLLRDAAIVVVCHHGVRSAHVADWLLKQGWTNVRSLAGGLDAYAHEVDASVGFY